jgi:tRNA-specific 2-thiouridylase
MSRVLVAMSGGVDSSVAAALLQQQGHEVVGATMKLWGGSSDSGCCSVADVEDARRVAQQLGIVHHVFNFTADFDRHVVGPYVDAHVAGRTPNPCVECNRHLKFDRFLQRAMQLGFDAIATGHHARVHGGTLRRGADRAKDQSYVLAMLGPHQLARLHLPVGELTKDRVRAIAADHGLRTAAKPDSQDVCFVLAGGGGRTAFLGDRIPLRGGVVVDTAGNRVGTVPAVELVTIGQRRGIGTGGGTAQRTFVVDVDVPNATVVVGTEDDLLVDTIAVTRQTWTSGGGGDGPVHVGVQTSAHGRPFGATYDAANGTLALDRPQRRPAPGQTVALYDDGDGDVVVGSAVVT